MLTLTEEEAQALYELIEILSGHSPGNVFAWDGTDTLDDVHTRAAYKLFRAAGQPAPSSLDLQEIGAD